MLLRCDVVGNYTEMEMHIFTEIVRIQMLLMGMLEPPLRGERYDSRRSSQHMYIVLACFP